MTIFAAHVSATRISLFFLYSRRRHSAAFFRTTGRHVGEHRMRWTSGAMLSENSRPPTFATSARARHWLCSNFPMISSLTELMTMRRNS